MDDGVTVLGHEVRNLLATFMGFSELLLTHDWPRAQQREYLQTMRDEAGRVGQFLNDLLDLDRIESGSLRFKARQTDVASLLRFAASVAAHDLEHPVVLDCPADLPISLAEPDRIQQVLANLLSNARKYTPEGGEIRLSARQVGGSIEINVQDSGVGIPVEYLPRVFDKFFRVQSHRHRGIRGTGLGLAICRHIVEAHGGRIWAESEGLGRGARVTFSLPIQAGAPARRGASTDTRLSSVGEHRPARQADVQRPGSASLGVRGKRQRRSVSAAH